MKANYSDIFEKIQQPPDWFDENGVPRFCHFHPEKVANIYAEEVKLLRISCQNCQHQFNVSMSIDHADEYCRLRFENNSYGDPPNIGCCLAGPTMTSVPLQIVEYWKRDKSHAWVRDQNMEKLIENDWEN